MATTSQLTPSNWQLASSGTRLARHNPLAAIGVALVILFVLCAIFAPWIAPQDPAHIDLPNRLETPSSHHLCGTDELGRDILSRLIWGARISLFVGSSVVVGSLFLGLIIGSLAGYYGGGIDRFVNVVLMNAFLSFPGILIAIAFVAFRGPGIFNLILALSLGGWVGYARLVRGLMMAMPVAAGALETSADHVRTEGANHAHHVAESDVMAVPHLEGFFRSLGESEIGNPGKTLFHSVIAVGGKQLQSANDTELIQQI